MYRQYGKSFFGPRVREGFTYFITIGLYLGSIREIPNEHAAPRAACVRSFRGQLQHRAKIGIFRLLVFPTVLNPNPYRPQRDHPKYLGYHY